jgi:CBS domain-containing protein
MPHRPIREIINRGKLVTASETTSVAEAARLMTAARVGAILVLNKGGLAGIFTERDALTRVLAAGLEPETTPLGRVMTANPDTITPNRPFGEALIMMYDHGYRHVPVVEDDVPVGIVSMRDTAPPRLEDLEAAIKATAKAAARKAKAGS